MHLITGPSYLSITDAVLAHWQCKNSFLSCSSLVWYPYRWQCRGGWRIHRAGKLTTVILHETSPLSGVCGCACLARARCDWSVLPWRCFCGTTVFIEYVAEPAGQPCLQRQSELALFHAALTVGWPRSIRSNLRNVKLPSSPIPAYGKQRGEAGELVIRHC